MNASSQMKGSYCRPRRLVCLLLLLLSERSSHALSGLASSSPNSNHHHRHPTKSPLQRAGGILYRQSIFTPQELETIQSEVAYWKKTLREETSSSVAQNRLGVQVPTDAETVRLLQQGSIRQWIQSVVGSDMELSSNIPVEIRTYEKVGAGMAWHEDDVLYDPPQVEVVITLENNSDCQTMWKDPNQSFQVVARETDPNSALILMAGGPSHCVSSLKRGKRVILKCAYASKDAVYRQDLHTNQFEGSKKGKPIKSFKQKRRK